MGMGRRVGGALHLARQAIHSHASGLLLAPKRRRNLASWATIGAAPPTEKRLATLGPPGSAGVDAATARPDTTLLPCFFGGAGSGRVRLGVVAPEPNLAGAHYRLGAVGDLQLGEDVGDVVAHRLGAHVKLPGYLGIGAAPGYEVQNLHLAGG
jgi:hypothetical protein